jgi:Coenzyme PQQ synthesis protein D (PqqD)
MKLTDKISISPEVIARKLGNEIVLLDLASGTYFGLDPIGARLWQLLDAGKSLATVCDVMVDEYQVSREVLERDALDLAHELAENNLIRVE